MVILVAVVIAIHIARMYAHTYVTSASSTRFYYEFWHNQPSSFERLLSLEVSVPTAMALFPAEIPVFTPIRMWANAYYHDIVQWNNMPRGGHFAALEEPMLLAKELWKFRAVLAARSPVAKPGEL